MQKKLIYEFHSMKVAKSPRAREGGASIGDRLALDDSAID